MLFLFLVFAGLFSLPLKLFAAEEATPLQDLSRSVAFLYDGNTEPCAPSQGATIPLGSGFIVGIPDVSRGPLVAGEKFHGWQYLVTAEHVIGDRNSIILRANRNQKTEFACFPLTVVRTGPHQNFFVLKDRPEVDLVAVDIPDIPGIDFIVYPYSTILDFEQMAKNGIGQGAEVISAGYLFGYAGNGQNFPMPRFGKLAILTEERWYRSPRALTLTLTADQQQQIQNATSVSLTRLPVSPGILEFGYVIELQANPGLSGAPVIISSTPEFRVNSGSISYRSFPAMIVGVMKGLMHSPTGLEGAAVIEPAAHLRLLMQQIAAGIKGRGIDVQIDAPIQPKKK